MEQPVFVQPRRYTVEDYFDLEAGSDQKWEFRKGEVVCMPGGTVAHALITANVIVALGSRLRGTPCRVHSESLRVQMARRTLYGHPDVTVVCGEAELDPDDRRGQTIVNPRLIVEVLSPSTRDYDRTKKFHRLMRQPSLQEYVLIEQDDPYVQSLYRHPDGVWRMVPAFDLHEAVHLTSIGVDLPLAEVYSGVTFPPAQIDEN